MAKSKKIIAAAAVVAIIAAIIAAAAACAPSAPTRGEAYARYFNVGQGDAAVFVWDGGAVLFDAGTNDSEDKLVSYLRAMGVDRLDAMVLSHPHDDHIGGADAVLHACDVGEVIMPSSSGDEEDEEALFAAVEDEGCPLYEAKAGDVYEFGDVKVEILSPLSYTGDANDDSAVAVLTFGKMRFMFTGDIESGGEAALLNAYGADALDVDVLKVAHHGSSTSTREDFLEAVSPDIAVISCGVDNDYGHPHAEVVERLESHGVEVMRTDMDGAVTVYTDGESVYTKK